jgi:hypothetical protein
MRKIIFAIFLIFISSEAFAAERAEPLDFIFKGGDYSETTALVMEKPYSGKIPGPDNVSIIFACPANCIFTLTATDKITKTNSYTAQKNSTIARLEKQSPVVSDYILGVIYKTDTSQLLWFADETGNGAYGKIWSREFTEDEYQLLSLQSTITARTGANAVMVQYSGTEPDTGNIVFDITDANAPDMFIKKIISQDRIPGYFEISNGGILHIEKIFMEGTIPVLLYEWVKEPRIQIRDHVY